MQQQTADVDAAPVAAFAAAYRGQHLGQQTLQTLAAFLDLFLGHSSKDATGLDQVTFT